MTKSTITRDQLRALAVKKVESLKFAITQSAFTNIRRGLEEELQLAEFALAALDSEPVAYISKSDFNAGYPHTLARRDFNKACTMPVYAAQPTPVVPDKMTAIVKDEDEYVEGWNACRAAMLNGAEPVSQTYKLNELSGNSPVTPDGWISCSERMPNDKQYVWCWGKSYGWTECDTFEGYYDCSRNKWWAVTDNGEEPASKVTHWMPLPEPPQEVK